MIETTQQSGSLAQIGRLVRLGFRHPHLLVLNILGLLAMGGLSFVLVLLSQTILEVFGPVLDDAGHRFSPEELAAATDRLMELGILLTSLAVPAGLVAAGSWWIGQYLASRCVLDLRDMFMRHFVGLDMEFHAAAAKGDMITRMSGDMEQAQSVIQSVFGKTSQRPLEIIATIVAVFVVEWRLASILFLILLPVILILSRLFKRTKRRAQRARKSMAATMTAFEQAASGVRVIKSVGEEVTAANSFNATTTRLMRDEMRTVKTRAHADLVSYGIAFLIPGLTMFASIWLLRSNAISGAEVGAFLVGLIRITTMLRTTQRAFGAVMQKLPGAARIFAILDREPVVRDRPDARPCPEPREALRLERVCFRYASDAEEVLHDCDLEIPVGKTVALVGESGAGKSTILDLLPRFYDVTGGRITIDGIDVRDLQQASLVHRFAIVQQDSFLFNDTVERNIAYGRPDATREQIEAAARRAHVHDAILALEGGLGYDTVVGDRGERLSGGQRQRVAIARALLRDAPILILDEPTSALDAESESRVQAALAELMRGRTSIVVAHRLATIQHADVIHVLARSEHRVIESGTHAELLARDGEYARLVRLQQLLT